MVTLRGNTRYSKIPCEAIEIGRAGSGEEAVVHFARAKAPGENVSQAVTLGTDVLLATLTCAQADRMKSPDAATCREKHHVRENREKFPDVALPARLPVETWAEALQAHLLQGGAAGSGVEEVGGEEDPSEPPNLIPADKRMDRVEARLDALTSSLTAKLDSLLTAHAPSPGHALADIPLGKGTAGSLAASDAGAFAKLAGLMGGNAHGMTAQVLGETQAPRGGGSASGSARPAPPTTPTNGVPPEAGGEWVLLLREAINALAARGGGCVDLDGEKLSGAKGMTQYECVKTDVRKRPEVYVAAVEKNIREIVGQTTIRCPDGTTVEPPLPLNEYFRREVQYQGNKTAVRFVCFLIEIYTALERGDVAAAKAQVLLCLAATEAWSLTNKWELAQLIACREHPAFHTFDMTSRAKEAPRGRFPRSAPRTLVTASLAFLSDLTKLQDRMEK